MRIRSVIMPLGACLGVGIALTLGAAPSWAPPAVGAANVIVTSPCVPYGRVIPVSARGFAPGTTVNLSAGPGNYVGPAPFAFIASVDARVNGAGGVEARLRASRDDDGTFHPLILRATGKSEVGGGDIQTDTAFLIASAKVCRTLTKPAKARH